MKLENFSLLHFFYTKKKSKLSFIFMEFMFYCFWSDSSSFHAEAFLLVILQHLSLVFFSVHSYYSAKQHFIIRKQKFYYQQIIFINDINLKSFQEVKSISLRFFILPSFLFAYTIYNISETFLKTKAVNYLNVSSGKKFLFNLS